MSVADTYQDLTDPERAILEALESAESNIMQRVDVADVVDEPYPPHERKLTDRGLIEEVGVHSTYEDSERVVYRRLSLTDEGERLLAWADRHGGDASDEDVEPDPVEPTRRPSRQPWYKRADWTELSETVPRLLAETQSVEFAEEDDMFRVAMSHEDRDATVEFTRTAWFNTGHRRFAEEYHAKFNERNPITEREWGILQQQWVDRFAGQESDTADSDDPPTQKERAKAYLAGEGADDSVRAAAEHLEVSVGTVQNARDELADDVEAGVS